MIFHVIGVNQIFGVFDVSALVRRHTVRRGSPEPIYMFRFFWLRKLCVPRRGETPQTRSDRVSPFSVFHGAYVGGHNALLTTNHH